MKRMLIFIVLVLSVAQVWSQNVGSTSSTANTKEDRNFRIPLIGESAPAFKAESTNGEIFFPGNYGRKWKILFSHPQDFTPVCTSEILALAHLQTQFDKLGCKLIVISTDPLDTHIQWKKAMEDIAFKNNDAVNINFPIVDDHTLAISKQYGMIHATTNTTRDVRGVFIVDPDDNIAAIYFYPMHVGRSTDELIRMIQALKTTYSDKVMTPANWQAGNDVLVPYPPKEDPVNPGLSNDGYYNLAWFMWYKKVK